MVLFNAHQCDFCSNSRDFHVCERDAEEVKKWRIFMSDITSATKESLATNFLSLNSGQMVSRGGEGGLLGVDCDEGEEGPPVQGSSIEGRGGGS